MTEIEKRDLEALLNQVSIISKKYEHIAEVTGENYNVFNVLGLGNDELSHSAILANLLNAKGSHNQGDVFLKLFIETINERFNLSNFVDLEGKPLPFDEAKIKSLSQFDTIRSNSTKEKDLGQINGDNSTGGRIDIIISDKKSNIIIENKIYAVDQDQQLVRYKNYDVNAPIFYLNLFGENPDEKSIKDNDGKIMKVNEDFFIISYKNEIKEWLTKCIEKVSTKPFIRETLNQYLNLILANTDQSNNKIMSTEIAEVVLNSKENIKAFIELHKSRDFLASEMLKKINAKLVKYLIENHYKILSENDCILKTRGTLVSFENEILASKGLSIVLGFQELKFNKLIIQICEKQPNKVIKLMNTENSKNTFNTKFTFEEKYSFWTMGNMMEFYTDVDFKENFIPYFQQKLNLLLSSI